MENGCQTHFSQCPLRLIFPLCYEGLCGPVLKYRCAPVFSHVVKATSRALSQEATILDMCVSFWGY